jgi:RimJ/RimL family protein N-acetyltransferase
MQAGARVANHIPVIETERLRLRAHRQEDFDVCCAMWADPVVIRHTTGKPQSPEEVWWKMLRYAGLWSLLGYGYWAVAEKASDRYIGDIGFADFKRSVQPSIEGIPESGWAFVPEVHGKGYATEALRAVLNWGDEQFGESRTCCLIHPDNTASTRLAEKCGYGKWTQGAYKEHEVLLFTR